MVLGLPLTGSEGLIHLFIQLDASLHNVWASSNWVRRPVMI